MIDVTNGAGFACSLNGIAFTLRQHACPLISSFILPAASVCGDCLPGSYARGGWCLRLGHQLQNL